MHTSLRLIELDLPLQRPFETAAGTIRSRRVVLVGARVKGITGWGEAAPYPGHSPENVDDVWRSLCEGVALPPTASAAVEAATADLKARIDGVPLWMALGGSTRPLAGSIAIGLSDDPVRDVTAVAGSGYRGVKMKVRPGHDLTAVAAVRERFPDLVIGVDGNGSYTWEERHALVEMDALDVAYLEQPFAADDWEAHRRLREETVAAVALDESIDSIDAAITAIDAGAADLLVLKAGRIGLGACRTIHDLAVTAGIRVKASGLIETSVGRTHTLAVATLPGATHNDLATADAFLTADPIVPVPELTDGWFTPSASPGIGCDPDEEALAPYLIRETVVPVPPTL